MILVQMVQQAPFATILSQDSDKEYLKNSYHHHFSTFLTLCACVIRSRTASEHIWVISCSCFAFMDHVPCSYEGIWTLDGAVLDASHSPGVMRLQQQVVFCVLLKRKPAEKAKRVS